MKPDRLQPASGAVTAAIAVILVIILFAKAGPILGILVLLACPFWIANVTLGGGMNEPLWNVFGRVQRYRNNRDGFF